LICLVPEKGIEPSTFSLRMRDFVYLVLLIYVDRIHINQQVEFSQLDA
jgi:hypothetical protein